jgi:hypothetical protein
MLDRQLIGESHTGSPITNGSLSANHALQLAATLIERRAAFPPR